MVAQAGTNAPHLVPAGAGGGQSLSVAHFSAGWSHQPVLIGSHGHCSFGPVLNLHVSTGQSRDRY